MRDVSKFHAHLPADQARDRGRQRLGRGRRHVALDRVRPHHRLRPRGVRPARCAAGLQPNTTHLFAAPCGWKIANRYAPTGDRIDAAEAPRIGRVNEVGPHAELLSRARALGARIALVPQASVRVNKAVTLPGVLSAGLFNGLLLNGPLRAIVHASGGGPERARLGRGLPRGRAAGVPAGVRQPLHPGAVRAGLRPRFGAARRRRRAAGVTR